ncbi:class I SAM-dependent methyltransferase [Actinomadura graeca]|uniref:Class I SAM-dependent methyltransferase n=1 Tax=Actinomadura graeca TaxID=2750812 RepID=A0ABX8QQ70_9ACTN|nr:class I SAM-dependent methyltransferase [Actinomadura graeca]QXJ20897.1 class I SAM-dependent methyltransferase [Actinomadura graeca]
MNLLDLLMLYGANAPVVLALLALFAAGVIVVSLRQGRSISLWPPSIGAPDTAAPARVKRFEGVRRCLRDIPRVDREYGVDRAHDFYQKIARNYDLRNSGNLGLTQLATVAQIQALRSKRSSLRVLDLGGGTGKMIAVQFFNDDAISWTYVDISRAMAAELRQNLVGCPLGDRLEVIVDDLNKAIIDLPAGTYDVIILSVVLSSMPHLPDFGTIARLLAPGGTLIITDINPGYTRDKPLYKVTIDRNAVVALRTNPVDPYEVVRRATAAGLHMAGQKTIGEGSTYYAFMAVFTAGRRGG